MNLTPPSKTSTDKSASLPQPALAVIEIMKLSLKPALATLAFCLGGMSAFAKNDIEPTKEFYTVVHAPAPIVLDGELGEWSGVPILADPKFAVPKGSGSTSANPNYVLFEQYAGGTWSGPDDQTSAVQIVYDTDNVYFGFVVTDDYHENSANSAWNGDSIQLMIASGDRTSQVALYNYALGGIEGATADVIVMHEAGPGGNAECNCATEAVVKRNEVTKKTTYEIKLPKAALGLTSLRGGPKFGLGMAINDGDNGPGQAGQKGWGGLGAHAIVFGKTPSETAEITLSKGNDIEPGKEYYTALKTTKAIVLDGALGEWTGAPVLADPKFAVPKGSGSNPAVASPNYVLFEQYAGGTWSGPDDQTSAVQVVYDNENVYFGFVVTDDYHENAANSAWNGDSIQLMIASADRTQQIALYNYALGGIEGATGDVIVMHEAGPGGSAECNCATEAIVTRNAATKKTTYEIKLPAAALGLTPPLTVGTKFGLGMAINDGDNGPGQAGQKGWGGLGAHAIVFGKTPSETAEVTLGTTVTGSDRLFLSAVNPGLGRFTFRATDKGASIVDPAATKLSINGKDAPLTAVKSGDATDFTHTASSALALGATHSYIITAKDTLGTTVVDQGTFKINPIKVGLNFGADEPVAADPAGSALAADIVAGVPAVAQANWNNLSGASTPLDGEGNPVPFGAKTDTAGSTSVTVTWESSNTWSSTGSGEENNAFAEGNLTLMTGYLDAADTSTTKVNIAGIPDALTAGGYDLYVYTLDGVAGAGGRYRVVSPAGAVLKPYVLAKSPTNPSSHAAVVAGSTPATGTYLVFSGLKAGAITIEAQAQGAGTPAGAPINAIQLVPTAVPAGPTVSTTPPSGLGDSQLTGVVVDATGKTITADLPATGASGFLTITPSVTISSVKIEGGKLVIKYQ